MNTPISSTTTIFLDIDGVLADLHGLNPTNIENLNWILENVACVPPVQIVTNTAWNTYSVEEFREAFVEKGFRHRFAIVDKTDSCEGGGAPIRRWIAKHNFTGNFIILDDNSFGGMDNPSTYHGMWGRFVHTEGQGEMLSVWLREQAVQLIRSGIPTVSVERRIALNNLKHEKDRLRYGTPWLTDEQREGYIGEVQKMMEWCHTATSEELCEKSCLALRTLPYPSLDRTH